MKRQGFTVLELIVVIALIALLAGILIPALAWAIRDAKGVSATGQMRGIAEALDVYHSDLGGFPDSTDVDAGVSLNGSMPQNAAYDLMAESLTGYLPAQYDSLRDYKQWQASLSTPTPLPQPPDMGFEPSMVLPKIYAPFMPIKYLMKDPFRGNPSVYYFPDGFNGNGASTVKSNPILYYSVCGQPGNTFSDTPGMATFCGLDNSAWVDNLGTTNKPVDPASRYVQGINLVDIPVLNVPVCHHFLLVSAGPDGQFFNSKTGDPSQDNIYVGE